MKLNDAERDHIQRFLKDDTLFQIVQKALHTEIFNHLPVPEGESDEQLGQRTRAIHVGIRLVEEGFKQLQQLKVEPPNPKKVNKNR